MKLISISLLFLFTLFYSDLSSAQDSSGAGIQRAVISSFGGSKTSNTIYISHTAGQASAHTQVANEGIVLHQGFEQALQFTGQNQTKIVRMVVYPNPNSGIFFVATDLPRGTRYTLTVFDLQAKPILNGEGEGGTESHFEVPEGIAPGTYPAMLQTADGLKAETKIVIL
jgi:hypothetical protein